MSPSPQSQVERVLPLGGDRVRLGVLLGREMAVDLPVGAEVAAHRRGQQALLEAAHRRRCDQLVEAREPLRQLDDAVGLDARRARPPVPEARRLALEVDLVDVAQRGLVEASRPRPRRCRTAGRSRAAPRAASAQSSVPSASPRQIASITAGSSDGSSPSARANVALQRASLVDDLGLRAKLGALHSAEPNGSTPSRSRLSVAASSSMPEAAAFSCTCSGRDAPTIAEATFSSREHPGERELGHRDPEPFGDRDEALRPARGRRRSATCPSVGPSPAASRASPSGGASPGRYLPVRAPWRAATRRSARCRSRRQSGITSRFGLPPEQRVLRLRGDELAKPCSRLRSSDAWICCGAPLAEADVARLAGSHDLAQRRHRLLERRLGS